MPTALRERVKLNFASGVEARGRIRNGSGCSEAVNQDFDMADAGRGKTASWPAVAASTMTFDPLPACDLFQCASSEKTALVRLGDRLSPAGHR